MLRVQEMSSGTLAPEKGDLLIGVRGGGKKKQQPRDSWSHKFHSVSPKLKHSLGEANPRRPCHSLYAEQLKTEGALIGLHGLPDGKPPASGLPHLF